MRVNRQRPRVLRVGVCDASEPKDSCPVPEANINLRSRVVRSRRREESGRNGGVEIPEVPTQIDWFDIYIAYAALRCSPDLCSEGSVTVLPGRVRTGWRLAAPLASAIANGISISHP